MEQIAGIHYEIPKNELPESFKKYRDTYEITPGAPIYMKEFGYLSIDRWVSEGHINSVWDLPALCGMDQNAVYGPYILGWCEAAFMPMFEDKLLEDRGETELVQDCAGRKVSFFKGRRNGYMPAYEDHPVKDMKTWEALCKWRLDPKSPDRLEHARNRAKEGVEYAKGGYLMQQPVIGGYMYLRSLIGDEELMYQFYDAPELIHDCMKTWFDVSDTVIAEIQKFYTLDELYLGEDICYNHGSLISAEMMDEFLLPYYQQLIDNIKKRQIDKNRKLYIYVDTDGDCRPVIPVYKKLGLDVMSPFEVASNCDVVEIGKQYPDLVLSGGIDKRELANGKEAIDRMLDRIMPTMKARGGYIPTCDHDVPAEVAFEDYLYFRKRLAEY